MSELDSPPFLTTINYKMSSYRPPHKQNYRDRESERRQAERRAEEEQRKKIEMNESNFPTLSNARPMNERERMKGGKFARLAENWAIDDEVDRRMEEYRRFRAAADEFTIHRNRNTRRQEERYENEEDRYEEEETPTAPSVTNSLFATNPADDEGWSTVKSKKTYKPKRELTVEEMDERDRQRQKEEDAGEFNSHLFDSNRHDHDRV